MLKLLTVILLFHQAQCLSPTSVLYTEIFDYHNETSFKAEFALQVVNKIYNAFRQWYFTIIFCEFTYFENRILKYTENTGDGYPVLLINGCPFTNKAKVKPRINKDGVTAYVVTSDELSLDVNEFAIEALIRTGIFQPRHAVIFVINVPVEVDNYFYYTMEQHFQLLWSRKITNSVLLVWSDKLRMYTYNPFFNYVREITDVKDVSKFLSQQYINLSGHELRLSVFRKAFISDETGPVKCDSRLAQTVMTSLNASCLPLIPRDGNTVGDLLDDGTVTGVTADLMDGYTDLELNSRILKNSYYGYIDTTYPLLHDELCFLVKKSEKESTFAITIQLITINLLSLFIFNVVFLTVVAVLTRKLEVNLWGLIEDQTAGTTVMDLVKCFLRQTVDIKFLGPLFRFEVLLIIMYSLVVDCVIDGIITSAISYPRDKPELDSSKELIENTNLTFAVHARHFKLFNKSLTAEYYDRVQKRIEVVSDKRIKEIIEKRQYQYAILLRKSDALVITSKSSNMKNGKPIYHTMQECPIPCSIVYGLRYGSPYLPRVNYILHHLNQAGILRHWTQAEEYSLFKGSVKSLYGNNKERKPLNTDNLLPVFYVWLMGVAISCVFFLLELFIHSFIQL